MPVSLKMLALRVDMWIALLWDAMGRTGRGYRKPSLKHTGRGEDRRPDKLERAERALRNPIFTGRLNVPRRER